MLFEGELNEKMNNINKGTLKIPGQVGKYTFKMSLSDKVFECNINIELTTKKENKKVELEL